MKLHATRYGLTAGLGSLTSSAVSIGLPEGVAKWFAAMILAVLVGLLCTVIIPYNDQGDK